jgi:hypothetical protein
MSMHASSKNRRGRFSGSNGFRFPNAEQLGTIRAVQPFNRFALATAGNRLQDAI